VSDTPSISAPSIAATIGIGPSTPRSNPTGRGAGIAPAPSGSGAGRCLYGQGVGRLPAAKGSGAGAFMATGSGTGKLPAPFGSGQGLLDQLVQDFANVGLVSVGYFDGKYKVRTNGSGLACAWDDRGAATDTGRATFAGIATHKVGQTIAYTGLNGATKAMFGFLIVPYSTGPSGLGGTVICLWGNIPASQQVWLGVDRTSGSFTFRASTGTVVKNWKSTTVATPGTLYFVAPAYDGTQATDLAKVVMYIYAFDPVAQTWSAEVVDTGSSVDAGFPAALLSVAGRGMQMGNSAGSGTGADPYYGLMDDVKVLPGTLLTTAAQRVAWRDSAQASPDWIAAALWYPFNDFLNYGTAGHTLDGTVSGDIVLCTDDRTAGRTLISGSTNACNYDAVNGVVSGDGVSKFMRAVGGQLTRIGATDDYAIVLIGQEPSVANGRWATTGTLDGTTSLHAALNAGGQIEAESGTRIADLARAAGVRVVVVRRRSNGTDVAIKDGNGAEQLGTSGAASATAPVQLNIFASLAGANFGDGSLRGILILKGNISGLQSVATRSGAVFDGATV